MILITAGKISGPQEIESDQGHWQAGAMLQFLKTLVEEDAGQDLIEYALVAALMGVAAVSALKVLSNTVGSSFNGIDNTLTNSVPQGNSGGH